MAAEREQSMEPISEGSALGAKIIALVLFAAITLACGLLPLLFTWLARRCRKSELIASRRRRRWTELLISCIMCLGGGVLIATIFLHMLPEIRELFEIAEKQDYIEDIGVPIGELFLCVGFFMVFFLEQIAHAIMSHGHRRKQKAKLAGAPAGIENPAADINDADDEAPSKTSEDPIDHHEHDHEVEAVTQKSFRAYLVVLALSVHSIFEGLAVGFEDTAHKVWILFFALLAHKVIVAFCIGQQLLNTKRNVCFVISTFSIFAFATPLGVGIGTAISDASMGAGTLLATGILQSLAAGTILYVIFFELLGHELQKQGGGLVKFLAALTGFGLMLLVHTSGDHAHSHGGHQNMPTHGHSHGNSIHPAGGQHPSFQDESVEDAIRNVEERANLNRELDHRYHDHAEHRHNIGKHSEDRIHAGHEHSDHAGHDHSDHEGHEHSDHAGHEHSDHAGHEHSDHAGHEHSDHAGHDNSDHEGHEHSDHAGHEHSDHAGHDHSGQAGHDHSDHAGNEHSDHAGHEHSDHEAHGHSDHAGHEQSDHEGPGHSDNEGQGHSDHAGHRQSDHEGHGHSDHAGHEQSDHAGHDHSDHEGHEHSDHAGHEHTDHEARGHSDHAGHGHSDQGHEHSDHAGDDNSDHEGHGHSDHAGHEQSDNVGRDHLDHEGHEHLDHTGHEDSDHEDHGHSDHAGHEHSDNADREKSDHDGHGHSNHTGHEHSDHEGHGHSDHEEHEHSDHAGPKLSNQTRSETSAENSGVSGRDLSEPKEHQLPDQAANKQSDFARKEHSNQTQEEHSGDTENRQIAPNKQTPLNASIPLNDSMVQHSGHTHDRGSNATEIKDEIKHIQADADDL